MSPGISSRRAMATMLALSLAAFTLRDHRAAAGRPAHAASAPTWAAPDTEIGLLVTGYAVVVFARVGAADPAHPAGPPPAPARRHPAPSSRRRRPCAALAPSYAVLAGARLVTALTQALFWSVVAPTAIGLFPAGDPRADGGPVLDRRRARAGAGRAVRHLAGPAGGLACGVRGLAAVGLATGVAVVALLPSYPAGRRRRRPRHVTRPAPLPGADGATALGITGFMTAQTYITPFLLDVTGFAPRRARAAAVRLRRRGRRSARWSSAASSTPGRSPRSPGRWSLLTVALLGLYALGALKPGAVGLLAAGRLRVQLRSPRPCRAGCCRWRRPAPTSPRPWTSSAFNAGIAGGSFLGGVILPAFGARPLALVGGALTLAALAVLSVDAARRRHDPEPAREMRMAGCGV